MEKAQRGLRYALYKIYFRKSGALASAESDRPLFSVIAIAAFILVVL